MEERLTMRAGKAATSFLQDRAAGFELVAANTAACAYPPHTHVSTVAVLLIRKGSAVLDTAEGCLTLRKKQHAVIPPHTRHALAADGACETRTLCIDTALFSPRLDVGRTTALGAFLDGAVAGGLLSRAERNTLLRCVRRIELNADGDSRLARLRRAMEAHPEQELSLDDMAGLVHADKGHLIRSFKKRYGLAPAAFLRQNRLRKARREMTPRGSLARVAVAAGFFDQSHFLRHFKKLYRMTPSLYRNAVQQSGG
jgi:AraC-like DNA-binding protein/mannose-6-phosphate isomerase-like protein (cupin superfamily)